MSYARINSFSPSKTTPKSTFSADQRRTALPSLLNSVFHDRGTLSNNEPKKLRQPRSSNNKYYNSVSTTRNLATPKHHGTDLPHSRNNPVIKYSDRGWMTPELVFGDPDRGWLTVELVFGYIRGIRRMQMRKLSEWGRCSARELRYSEWKGGNSETIDT